MLTLPRAFFALSLLVSLTVLLTAAPRAAEPFMPRYPAISPDGGTVIFSFQGDLWAVSANGGMATRLTAHPAYDSHPVFNPDGSMIAFCSDRHGDFDVYVMPAEGGTPTRLTFASTTDQPYAFSADGKRVYFTASRMFDYPMDRQIQSVPVTGGTPFRLVDMFGNEVAVSADGNRFIIGAGYLQFGRLRYRGTLQRDLYACTPGSDPVQLTRHDGLDTRPMAAPAGGIYWVCDDGKEMLPNIWQMDADGGNKKQITHFKEDGVRWADLNANGQRMVLERGTRLYVMDLPAAKPEALDIFVADDQIENLVTVESFSGDADEISVSGDGEEFAMIIKGDIVLVSKKLGGRAVAPIPGPSREEEAAFRPVDNADTLAFVTDRFGEKTLCLLVSDDPDESNLRKAKKHKIVQLTDGKNAARNPVWSPDGGKIAYTRGNADIHIMDSDGENDYTLTEHWSEPTYSWAPDGNWIAYSREDRNFNSDIWIIPAKGGEAVNISQHPDEDFGPVWSEDGSTIAWTSRRHDNQYDVFFTYLTKELDQRTREEWEIWEKTRDDKPKKKDGDEKKDDENKDEEKEKQEEKLVVKIDFEDIYFRARRATSSPNPEYAVALHPKGDKIFFSRTVEGETSLSAVNRFAEDEEEIISGKLNDIELRDKMFYLLSLGKPGYVSMDGGKLESTDFNARLTLDKPAIRAQVLDEGWRELNHWFYNPKMNGIDWPKLREKYAEWVKQAGHDNDFADIVNIMLGELNASHMGYYPDRDSEGEGPDDGYVGVEFDPAYTGDGLKVKWVLPDGPADETKITLLPGDIVHSVNGMPAGRDANLFAALEDQEGIPLPVTWSREGKDSTSEFVPVSWNRIRELSYRVMEKTKRAHVEEVSGKRVGYVHIQGMDWSEVERFEMNLYAVANDKEALIIDVRDNGGGWTTDMLLTILTQPVHAYTISRDGEIGYPQDRLPLYRWEKPVAVLCNAGSYSNAEIFSHAIKTIHRGPLVGEETGGNVISTGGWTTLDGGWIRLPSRGWYVWGDELNPSRNNKNEEAPGEVSGAVPDYPVPCTPADRIADRDPQLDKAIELMLQAANDDAAKPKPSDFKGDRNYKVK